MPAHGFFFAFTWRLLKTGRATLARNGERDCVFFTVEGEGCGSKSKSNGVAAASAEFVVVEAKKHVPDARLFSLRPSCLRSCSTNRGASLLRGWEKEPPGVERGLAAKKRQMGLVPYHM